jgi:hypothetical protein
VRRVLEHSRQGQQVVCYKPCYQEYREAGVEIAQLMNELRAQYRREE